jgi:transcriptional regulator with XRE-family HTH domain
MGKYDGKISDYPIGERIRYMRKDRRLTQLDLAKKLKISQGAMSQLEKGQINLTVPMLIQISYFLDVHPGVFFAEDNVFVFDIRRLEKIKHFNDLSPSLKRAAIKTSRLLKKWGLK